MMWRLHNALIFHTVYHVYCAQVWLNSHFSHWPLTHPYSQTNALFWLAQWLQPPESCTIEKGAPAQGGYTVDLLTARAEEKTTFMSRSGGQYHHTSTPRRADWKLIKNASLQWMTGRFCWSTALIEEAGRSRVPGAGEPLVASAIVSLPSSFLLSGSI